MARPPSVRGNTLVPPLLVRQVYCAAARSLRSGTELVEPLSDRREAPVPSSARLPCESPDQPTARAAGFAQKSRANQQHQSGGQLSSDNQAAQSLFSYRPRLSLAAIIQGRARIPGRGTHGAENSQSNRHQKDQHQRKHAAPAHSRRRLPVTAHPLARSPAIRSTPTPPKRAKRASNSGEQKRFRKELADKMVASSAQSRADG